MRRVGEAQHTALMDRRLAPYLAARDAILDAGRALKKISQPDRKDPGVVARLTAADATAFRSTVLDPLAVLADSLDAELAGAKTDGLDLADPFVAETLDGIEVTALRARFAHAIYSAAVEHVLSGSDDGWLARADTALDAARAVVARRHAALFDPDPSRLVVRAPNGSVYPFGYLFYAHDLCYWQRERAQTRNAVLSAGETVPTCYG